MNVLAIPKLKVYSFLFSMPIIDIAVNQILYRERLWWEWRIWVVSFPLIFVLGFFSWYARITASAKVEKKYPELNQTWKRLRFKMLVCCLSMVSTVLFIITIYSLLHIEGYYFNLADVWQGAVLSFALISYSKRCTMPIMPLPNTKRWKKKKKCCGAYHSAKNLTRLKTR